LYFPTLALLTGRGQIFQGLEPSKQKKESLIAISTRGFTEQKFIVETLILFNKRIELISSEALLKKAS